MALFLVAYPVVALLLLSAYRVMVVRNLLPLLPMLAVLLASGVAAIYARLTGPLPRLGVAGATAALLVTNFSFLAHAAATRRSPDPVAFLRQLRSDLDQHVYAAPCLTPGVRSMLMARGLAANTVSLPCESSSHVIFRPDEIPRRPQFPIIDFVKVYAPVEASYTYYLEWTGYDAVLVVTREDARRLALVP
jgi:hypothetical protein